MKNMLTKDSNLHSPKTFSILSLYVHLLDNYLDWLVDRLNQRVGTHVVTLNAEMAIMAEENLALSQAIQAADLVIPDGAGIIMYMRMRGHKHERCPGIELAASLIEKIGHRLPRPETTGPAVTVGQSPSSESLCFFGSTPETVSRAAQVWQNKYPNLSFLIQNGYVAGEEEAAWKQTLEAKQPQIIFVGTGVPRQELWIHENRSLCPNSIWIGVGGSFDIWAGTKSRAPEWLRNNNLEWSYRLYQEPWRWRRMLSLPKFFWRSLLAMSPGNFPS